MRTGPAGSAVPLSVSNELDVRPGHGDGHTLSARAAQYSSQLPTQQKNSIWHTKLQHPSSSQYGVSLATVQSPASGLPHSRPLVHTSHSTAAEAAQIESQAMSQHAGSSRQIASQHVSSLHYGVPFA